MGTAPRTTPFLRLVAAALFPLLGQALPLRAAEPTPAAQAAAPAAPAAERPAELPPEGWWVPATLKVPKSAEGRVAWRFTLREIITVDRENRLERRAADLKLVRAHTFSTQTPVPMLIELDEKQRLLTVTVLKPKAAFFTLNPAGETDVTRFDKIVINAHADSDEVREACEKASRCCRQTGHDDLNPVGEARTLTGCRDVLSSIRQDLASARKAIPPVCR